MRKITNEPRSMCFMREPPQPRKEYGRYSMWSCGSWNQPQDATRGNSRHELPECQGCTLQLLCVLLVLMFSQNAPAKNSTASIMKWFKGKPYLAGSYRICYGFSMVFHDKNLAKYGGFNSHLFPMAPVFVPQRAVRCQTVAESRPDEDQQKWHNLGVGQSPVLYRWFCILSYIELSVDLCQIKGFICYKT